MTISPRTFWKVPQLTSETLTHDYSGDEPRTQVQEPAANLVSSRLENGMHAPTLDIDLPCRLTESSTPGHFHLYIDKEMTWEKYRNVLRALAYAGVVEKGYCDAAVSRGMSFLRKPGVYKPGVTKGKPDNLMQHIKKFFKGLPLDSYS